jgi:hypothetical protein
LKEKTVDTKTKSLVLWPFVFVSRYFDCDSFALGITLYKCASTAPFIQIKPEDVMRNSILFHESNYSFLLAFMLICCAGAANSHAQTVESPETEPRNSLAKGAWALQFQINNDFSLSNFQGSTLSAKHHFSNKKALRFGISLSGNITDEDFSNISENTVVRDQNVHSIAVSTQYALYPSPHKNASLFFGAGPVVQHSRFKQTSTGFTDLSTTTSNEENTTWSTGISGVLGMEWFAVRNISFVAEYGTTLVYNSVKRSILIEQQTGTADRTVVSSSEGSAKGLQLGSGIVRFGLSAYF